MKRFGKVVTGTLNRSRVLTKPRGLDVDLVLDEGLRATLIEAKSGATVASEMPGETNRHHLGVDARGLIRYLIGVSQSSC